MKCVSYINTLNEEEKERQRRMRQEHIERTREERQRILESQHNLELVRCNLTHRWTCTTSRFVLCVSSDLKLMTRSHTDQVLGGIGEGPPHHAGRAAGL
jgi:hypothetical protein